VPTRPERKTKPPAPGSVPSRQAPLAKRKEPKEAKPKSSDTLRLQLGELERRNAELEAKCAELDGRLERADRTVKALRDVGLALGSTLDLDQLLELILGKIAELLEADRATLYLLDEQRGRLLSRIIIGDEARSIELPLGAGIAGQVAKYGQTIRIKDAYRDRRFSRNWDDVTGYRTRSILAAPMKNHVGRTIGVIQVLNKRAAVAGHFDEFSLHDEELLTALATQAAVSIDNSRLFLSVIQKNIQLVETKEQLEHRVSDLKLLFELESSMARASTFEDLARAVITEAARACGAQAGGLMVDEGEDGVWLYFIDVGRPDGLLLTTAEGDGAPRSIDARLDVRRVSVRRGEGIAGLAMRTNEAQHMGSPERDRDGDDGPVSARLGSVLGLSVTSAIAMPLEGPDDTPIGALALYNANRPGGFSQDARALLRLVSANASTAVRLFLSRVERERGERLSSIGRLLSGVMHDLRTPMTVIGGYVQLMAQTDDPKVRSEHAKLIAKQFDAIGAMQREILEFARGERTTFVRKVYLAKFFGEVEQHILREMEGTKVRLVMEVEDRGVARFDEGKMMRLVHNLARNAIEAMAERGGTLTVRVTREGTDLVVTFTDTGRGIPDEIRGRLFASFVTAGKPGGTGLGLAIVKKIVEEHQGSITVESSTGGAQFVVRLPQEVDPRAARESVRETAREPESSRDGHRRAGRRAEPAHDDTRATRRVRSLSSPKP
jgi:signal transduction histidine kinase/putative methionine-R-sulfoxide reductase with GAF domain